MNLAANFFCTCTFQNIILNPWATQQYTHFKPKTHTANAFGKAPLPFVHQTSTTTTKLFGLAQPSVEIGQKTAVKQKVGQKTATVTTHRVQTADPKTRKEAEFEEPLLYKVMLLGDEEYDQGHTIQRLCEVMEDIDEGLASTIFKSAQVAGKAMCGKYPLEHAEMYVEQLLRSDPMIFAELEEEDKI